jgi:hypothetical protein
MSLTWPSEPKELATPALDELSFWMRRRRRKKAVSKPDKFINFSRPFFARFKNFLIYAEVLTRVASSLEAVRMARISLNA